MGPSFITRMSGSGCVAGWLIYLADQGRAVVVFCLIAAEEDSGGIASIFGVLQCKLRYLLFTQ